MNPMMHGSGVRRLQELGDQLGFDYGPNDGIFGEDTQRVVIDLQKKYGLVVDGICGPKTWKAILNTIDTLFPVQPNTTDGILYDIVNAHRLPKLYARKRSASEVDGVTLHQTGCNMPSNPFGWGRLNAHLSGTQEGKVIVVNDFLDFIYHAQGLSRTTIGIEFEGNFHGVEGVEKTLWKGGGPAAFLNEKMLKGADIMFDLLVETFKGWGREWKYIYGHRQSSNTRRGDPGSEIWQKIAMVWADRLSLDECEGGMYFKKGSGRPIPQLWDHNCISKY